MSTRHPVAAAIIGELIILRLAAGLTIRALAKRIGVHEAALWGWEHGKAPGIDNLAAWAHALGARLALIGDSSE